MERRYPMKKLLCLLCMLMLLSPCLMISPALGEEILAPDMSRKFPVPASLENNPAEEGISPLTGLPTGGEPYTPILVVINNTLESYPHWGLSAASILFQMPNDGFANTKLMALFADEYPELAGGTRSARMTMLPMANAFGAAFASAGMPPIGSGPTSVKSWLSDWGYYKAGKYYNLLGNYFRERAANGEGGNALLAHIREIHEDLIKKEASFEARPFLFTNEPLETAQKAETVKLTYYKTKEKTSSNAASNCTFRYEEGKGYTRTSAAGVNTDRLTGEELRFANVIVMRVVGERSGDYSYVKNNMVGSGPADFFQNGCCLRGSWYRADEYSRLIFLDEQGKEVSFQRGKTFLVMTSATAEITVE